MATVYRVTNSLATKSGIARDFSVNVHHVISQEDGTLDATQLAGVAADFRSFYQEVSPWLANSISVTGTPHRIQIAKLATGAAGGNDDILTPVLYEEFYGITSVASTSLPAEVAICISHVGNIVGAPENAGSFRPRSRRRGRFYLGPVGALTSGLEAGTGNARVSTGTITALVDAFETLAMNLSAAIEPANRVSYGVYSPTADTFYSVEGCWVDDAFDTIRRRGIEASFRETRAIDLLVDHQGDVSEVP